MQQRLCKPRWLRALRSVARSPPCSHPAASTSTSIPHSLQVRHAVRAMRDDERRVEGAPAVPDVSALQRLRELSPPEVLALAVKLGARAAVELTAKV